jgi:hypothetical protein
LTNTNIFNLRVKINWGIPYESLGILPCPVGLSGTLRRVLPHDQELSKNLYYEGEQFRDDGYGEHPTSAMTTLFVNPTYHFLRIHETKETDDGKAKERKW